MAELNAFPLNDKKYTVQEYMMTLGGRRSGVVTAYDDNLKVVATPEENKMQVIVKSGHAFLTAGFETISAWIDSDTEITIEPSEGAYNRTDVVALCWNVKNLSIPPVLAVFKGNLSTEEYPDPINQDEFEIDGEDVDASIVLAKINVSAGSYRITNEDITDTRLDESLCGLSYDRALHEWIDNKFENIDATNDRISEAFHESRIVKANIGVSLTNSKLYLNIPDNTHLGIGDMALFQYTGSSSGTVYAPQAGGEDNVTSDEIYVAIMQDHCGVANAGGVLFTVGGETTNFTTTTAYNRGNDDQEYTVFTATTTAKSYSSVQLLLVRIR